MISINYRLAPKVKHPDELNDLISAILHIKKHAAEWNLDANRLYLYGTSAGGNLVTIAGLRGHNETAPYAVRAVAALCPLISFSWMWEDRRQLNIPFYMRMMVLYMYHAVLGGSPSKTSQEMKLASAENYIGKTIPAFYLQTGTQDPAIDYRHVSRFYDLLSKSENATPDNLVLELLEGAPHAGAGPDYLEPQSILPILEFFKRHS